VTILPDFSDDHWSLQRESQLTRFPCQHLVLQPKLSAVRVRLASKTASPPALSQEPGLLCLKWKIQLEEEYNFSLSRTRRVAVSQRAIH
jgi:hypothetical protein